MKNYVVELTGGSSAPVREFVDAYLALAPTELAETWNNGMPHLNRLLWAKLDSLPRNLFNKMMVRLTTESYLLQATAQKMKRLSELNALRAAPIDFNRRLLVIARRSVHNVFHHEVCAFAKEVQDTILHAFLVERINQLNRIMKMNIVE